MSNKKLLSYFDLHLKGMKECTNKTCNCVGILADGDIHLYIARYLCWFNGKTKYEQDSIAFEWFKYGVHPQNPLAIQNYCPNVPDEFQLDELYAEPSAEVWKKVKTKKIEWSEFQAKLKVTKCSKDKERIESMAQDKGEGKAALDKGEGKA